MKGNQNIIHSSSFNFDYENKASALRGNALIESIFISHIFPELEKAISNKIPNQANIELSKLEINIGNIHEKDLSKNLAERIRTELEKALSFNFDYSTSSGTNNDSVAEHQSDKFLIKSLEIFLTKGYFPFGKEKSVTIDEMVNDVMHQNKKDFIAVLLKHSKREQVIRRVVQNLKPSTFNKILISLDPVNSNWIIEFSETIMKLKKELNLNQYSDSEFIQTVNYFILKYLLNQTGLTFNKEKFSSHILKEVINKFKPDNALLIKAIQKHKDKTLIVDGLNESLAKLQEDKKPNRYDDRIQRLSTEQIIKILNGSIDFKTNNLNFLKDEIILAIRDKEKNEFLIEKLNDSGVANILRLFDKENPLEILQLIRSFTEGNKSDSALETDESSEIDKLVQSVSNKENSEIVEVLLRNRNKEQHIRRIVQNLNPKTFNEILISLDSVNSNWILEFSEIMMNLKKELNLDQYSDSEFLQMMNYFILKYVLNQTSLTFNKEKFSSHILKEVINKFKPDNALLIKAIQKYKDNTFVIDGLKETFAKLQKDKKTNRPDVRIQRLSTEQIVKILNGSIDFKTNKLNFLKDEIILAIRDKEKNEFLIEKLNDSGVANILRLFDKENPLEILQLISSFVENFAYKYFRGVAEEKAITLNKFVLNIVLYLHENLIRKLNNEELVILLIYIAGIDDLKIISSSEFQNFVQSEKSLGLKKMQAVIDVEQQYNEISDVYILFSDNKGDPKKETIGIKAKTVEIQDYARIYKRKIISYFLTSGELPKTFENLILKDVQLIFDELIKQKDNFLADQFKNNYDTKGLTERTELLISETLTDYLTEYIVHFFKDEYDIFKNAITEIIRHFSFETGVRINTDIYLKEILVPALIESKGGSLKWVFKYALLNRLNVEFAKDYNDSIIISRFLFAKSEESKSSIKQKENYDIHSKAYLDNAIERDFSLLRDKLHITDINKHVPVVGLKNIIKKIALYAQIDQALFLNMMIKNRNDLLLIYTLFKFYLHLNQLQFINKILLSDIKIKSEIEKVQLQTDEVLRKITEPLLDLKKKFEYSKESKSITLNTYLVLVINDEKLFETFSANNNQFPKELIFKNKQFQTYLHQLMSFFPGSFSGRISIKYWKSLILRFGILLYTEERKHSTATFTTTFMSYLLRNLKSINEAELFYLIVDKMKQSSFNGPKKMVELWQTSKSIGTVLTDTDRIGRKEHNEIELNQESSLKEFEHNLLILKFYARNGFLPWWAGQISLPDILNMLLEYSRMKPGNFKKLFLQSEKYEPFFGGLKQRVSGRLLRDFNQLFANYKTLNKLWEQIKLEKKQYNSHAENSEIQEIIFVQHNTIDVAKFVKNANEEPDLLLKGLYFFNDEQILNQWLKDSGEIANQISEYLKLAPFFYYRNITPASWRHAVYEFALNYYKNDKKRLNNNFHGEFLRFLKQRYNNVQWIDVLKSVYRVVQQNEIKKQIVFPEELVQILDIKPNSQQQINEVKMEELLSDEDLKIGIRVSNAGVILFWPFLTQYFQHLSLVNNGEFVDHESRNRAAYLLQYLAYNEIDFPEYKLVLNKVLVGMETENHLDPFIKLTDEEKDLSKSLFQGLISNWDKVQNSTPAGIQETFIQREGILRFEADKISLQVEKKGVDVLLSSIPWNISLIKLSWMKKPIYVEWL